MRAQCISILIVLYVFAGVAVRADTPPSHATPPTQLPTFEEAQRTARAEHKPLLIAVSAEWCVPCKTFRNTVLQDDRVKERLQTVVFIEYDAEEPPGIFIAERFRVDAFPTFIVVGANGMELTRKAGSQLGGDPTAEFISLITFARAPFEDNKNRKAAKTSIEDSMWHLGRGETAQAVQMLAKVAEDRRRPSEERQRAFRTKLDIVRTAEWRLRLAMDSATSITKQSSIPNVDDVIMATIDSPLPRKTIRKLYTTIFERVENTHGDVDYIYLALAAGHNDVSLEVAKQWTKRFGAARHFAALAECYFATGDVPGALGAIDRAIELSSSDNASLLRQERRRYDSFGTESDQVIAHRQRAAILSRRLADVDDVSSVQLRDDQSTKMARALRKLGTRAGLTCKSIAGGMRSAYAEVDIGSDGKVSGVMLYLSDGATKELRACLDRELRSSTLPVSWKSIGQSVPIALDR
jgi:thioredoxin-related protein